MYWIMYQVALVLSSSAQRIVNQILVLKMLYHLVGAKTILVLNLMSRIQWWMDVAYFFLGQVRGCICDALSFCVAFFICIFNLCCSVECACQLKHKLLLHYCTSRKGVTNRWGLLAYIDKECCNFDTCCTELNSLQLCVQ